MDHRESEETTDHEVWLESKVHKVRTDPKVPTVHPAEPEILAHAATLVLLDRMERLEKLAKTVLEDQSVKMAQQEQLDSREQGASMEYPVTWDPVEIRVLKVTPDLTVETERKESPDKLAPLVCLDFLGHMEFLAQMECLVQTVSKDHVVKKDLKDQLVTQVSVVLRAPKEFQVYLAPWARLELEETLARSEPMDLLEPKDEVDHRELLETLVPKVAKVSVAEKVQRETRDGEDRLDMWDHEEQTDNRETLDLMERRDPSDQLATLVDEVFKAPREIQDHLDPSG